MKIQTNCPQCLREYSVKSSLLGKKLKCKCGEVFQLQSDLTVESMEPSQVSSPSGFWDDKFDEIADDLPKEKPVVIQASKPAKQVLSFEAILPMDPYVGNFIYGVACWLVVLVLLPIAAIAGVALFWVSAPLVLVAIAPFPIFAVAASIYRYRAHCANHITFSMKNEGLSIQFHKVLPWPCKDLFVPVESIEEIRMETNTVRASWLLPRAEYSHTTYGSRSSTIYVFVYDLKCKLKNKRFETRLLTVENRDLAKTIRLHLKSMLPDLSYES
ncbi:MAG: hypothetical protein ACK449_11900 [Planctomycetota bacterium]|jgi:hypothetical protein